MLMCIVIKKLNSLVTELFTRERKLNISLVFIIQSYFEFRTKELQQIIFIYSSDIDFKDFMNLYRECTAKPYSSLVSDTTLPSDIYPHFRKNISERM